METNGEQLIRELDELRRKLFDLSTRLDSSGVERTHGLRATMGNDCPYFKKSMDIFMKKDYQELQIMIESINNLFLLIEGKKLGS
jgi:hypothetical protein